MNASLERELIALLAELEPAVEQLAEQLMQKLEQRIKDKLQTVLDRVAAEFEGKVAANTDPNAKP